MLLNNQWITKEIREEFKNLSCFIHTHTHTHTRSKCSNIKAVNILVKLLSYQSLRTDKREVNVLIMGEELRRGLQIHH